MNKLTQSLTNYWFAPLAPQRLALIRIATGAFSLWYLLNRVSLFSNLSESGAAMFDPVGAVAWLQAPLPDSWVQAFFACTLALNLAYLIGWKFRQTGPLFALSLLVLFSYRNSWSMIYHDMNALVLQVLVLGFAASAGAYAWDARQSDHKHIAHWRYGWPLKLVCAVTTLTYFVAGIAKVKSELGWGWATGESLRTQVAADTLRKEVLGGGSATPLFEWMYEHSWMFMIMGVATLILELGALLALTHRRAGMVWAVLTWLMHWGIFFVMGITFRFQLSGFIFLPFFDLEKIYPWLKKQAARFRQLPTAPPADEPAVVLFDGACSFCDASAQFIVRHDQKGRFLLAAQQSEPGKALLQQYQAPQDLSTIFLIENGRLYRRSTAILRIARRLAFPWPAAWAFILVPRPVRDSIYLWIAKNRYVWFGKKEVCEMPAPELRARFLM